MLIFAPGFSTADKVSDISGRGVGLDVVLTKIEALGGNVEIETEKDKGSRFIIRLPLTLAIIQALMVKLGDEKYAISLGAIETIEDVPVTDIKYIHAKEVINLRGSVIPLIRLRDILDVPGEQEQHPRREQGGAKSGIEKRDERIRNDAGHPKANAKRHHKRHNQVAFRVKEAEEVLPLFLVLQNSVGVLFDHLSKYKYLKRRINGDGQKPSPPGEVPLVGNQSDADDVESRDCPNDSGNQDQRIFVYMQRLLHVIPPWLMVLS